MVWQLRKIFPRPEMYSLRPEVLPSITSSVHTDLVTLILCYLDFIELVDL